MTEPNLLQASPPPGVQEGVVVEVPADAFGILGILDGGFMVWPILACAALVLGLSFWSASRLWGSRPDPGPRTRAAVDSVLFWGVFALVLGVLGTVIGISIAAQAIELAGEVHATLVWGGIRVALLTTVLGLLVVSVASLLWFLLQLRHRRLAAAGG